MLRERASLFLHRFSLEPQSGALPRAQGTSAESARSRPVPSPTATSTTSVLTDVAVPVWRGGEAEEPDIPAGSPGSIRSGK